MATRNPPWTREELILALDLFFQCNPSHTSQDDPLIVELSEVLNRLPTSATRTDAVKFRNPNGVYMKLCNFLRFDPSYAGVGLRRGAKLEEVIWNEFAEDRGRLHAEADAIRQGAAEATVDDADVLVAHSWRVVSPTVAIKTMDKSAFLHRGSGVPKEVRAFFGVTDATPGSHGGITLTHGGVTYDAHFHVDVTGTRLRLFWSPDFAGLIRATMPQHSEFFSRGETLTTDMPEMRFSRVGADGSTYAVSFLFPEELAADVDGDADPDERVDGGRTEGGVREYYGKRYERDLANRRKAIEIHGLECQACGFDFEQFYGARGATFIEVHHTKPLHALGEKQVVDPATDLATLCANCHRMVHRRKDDVLTVDALRAMIAPGYR